MWLNSEPSSSALFLCIQYRRSHNLATRPSLEKTVGALEGRRPLQLTCKAPGIQGRVASEAGNPTTGIVVLGGVGRRGSGQRGEDGEHPFTKYVRNAKTSCPNPLNSGPGRRLLKSDFRVLSFCGFFFRILFVCEDLKARGLTARVPVCRHNGG